MAIPIDLARITWLSGGMARFEVAGRQAAKDLLAEDAAHSVLEQQVGVSYDAAQRLVAVALKIDLQILAGTPPRPTGISGRFEIVSHFSVENLPDLMLVVPEQPEPAIHPQLELLLVSVAYSTSRGILATRLQGTPLEDVNLPLVDPKQLLVPAESAP